MGTKYQSVVLMGKTGSGKGTQARRLAAALGYEIFSTGDKVRTIAAEESELGKRISKIHQSGWVPEWLASYLMTKGLLEEYVDEGLVFESVARKPLEAQKFHEIHDMLGRSYIVLHLEISDEVVKERMRKRQRDAYDTEENMERRLQAYREETLKSIAFFAEQSRVVVIDADREEEAVFTSITEALAS